MALPVSRFDFLSEKYSGIRTFVDFKKQIINKLQSVYEWEGIEDYIPPFYTPQWLEYKLLKFGVMALGYVEGELTFAQGSFADTPSKRFGLPMEFKWYTNGGVTGSWEIGKDCVVLLANPSIYPDMFTVNRYSELLAEVDASIKAMLIYTRDIPIPLVTTDQEKKEVEKAIEEIRKNNIHCVQSFNISEIKALDLTKPEMIQYMTNYNLLHDELVKRLYLEFGIAIETKDKKAQLTTKELDAYSQLAGASFYQRYKLRQKFADDANKLFGCNISVKPYEYFDDLSNGRNADFAEGEQVPEQPEEIPEDDPEKGEKGNEAEGNTGE